MSKNKGGISIPVFKAEEEAGIANLVRATSSVTYATQLQDVDISQKACKDYYRSISSELDERQSDLFYINTILVSSVINKNFDAFLAQRIWAARHTPVHKQFNLEHDQSRIIGHMTSAKVVNDNYEIIPDDTVPEALPNKIHILTGAVIYRELADDKARENIETIIAEIKNGEWYVSMECLFRGFDYAVITPYGEQKIIARTEDTAWLTKHLRQYGGTGKYENYTIARVLDNITFSGKGLVRKPANPESIIFNENLLDFNPISNSLGYLLKSDNSLQPTESNSMAHEDSDVKAIKQQLEDLTAENSELKDKIKTFESSAVTAELETKKNLITSLEADVVDLKNKLQEKSDLEDKVKAAEDRAVKLEAELDKIKAEELVRSRVEKLVKMNAPEDEARKIVTLFNDKDEDGFNAVADLFSSKWKVTESKAKVEDVLNESDVEKDASLASNVNVNTDVEEIRQKMQNVFASILK